jgi:hypothetical protein
MSRNRPQYDVNEVVSQFLQRRFEDRGAMMRELQPVIVNSPQVKQLLAEIMPAAADNQLAPTGVCALGITYGILLGIYLERERAQREKRIT